MKYLLDVNALIAWHHTTNPHHKRFHIWSRQHGAANLVTCSITELGFLRVSMQSYGYTFEQANEALREMKNDGTNYIDKMPPPKLAKWATSAQKTTDAYLCQLAATHSMKLATFDVGIKDISAVLIT